MARREGSKRWVALALGLSLFGCKDAGKAHYEKARTQYRALMDQSKRPTDPAFDPVISELKQVPEGSAAYADAQRLLRPLEAARAMPPPPKPLVNRAPAEAEPADVAAQRQKCIELSQKLGQAKDAKARETLEGALRVCQLELEKAQESHHSDNP
jgi:hypothetical protein